jgi:integrase
MAFRKVGKIAKRLPAPEIIRTLFSAIASLRKEDENVYIAFLLAAHAGLRKAEVAGARLSWLDDSTPPRLWVRTEDDFKPKSGADRFIELQPWVAAELATLCAGRKHMLTGTLTERINLVFRRLNTWVKDRHFNAANGEKGVHGLRFLFGAYITNRKDKGGLYTAMKFLGHESQSTTEKHYADIMLDQSIFACWETAPAT